MKIYAIIKNIKSSITFGKISLEIYETDFTFSLKQYSIFFLDLEVFESSIDLFWFLFAIKLSCMYCN